MKNYKKILSQNLKEKRKALGLTQYELAEILNVEDKYISRIETGSSTPSFALLEKIANVLQINLADLFNTEDQALRTVLLKRINERLLHVSIEQLQIIDKLLQNILN